jgi:minor extracellular serine protease Vpr
MNSGPQGNDPIPLTTNEYDRYLILGNGDQSIHLAWHVLPRKAARVVVGDQQQNPSGGPFNAIKLTNSIGLTNTGVGTAQNEAYSLLALSPSLTECGRGKQSPTPDIKAIGVNSFEVDGGVCSASPSYIVALAVNTWKRQTHANWPGIYQFNLDTNQDWTADYSVFNGGVGLEGGESTGPNVTWVLDRQTEDISAVFYIEHATNTANTVLYFCGEQIGNGPPHQEIDVTVEALDIYFGGPGDVVSGITFAPLGERYRVSSLSDLPAGESEEMAVVGLDSVADNSGDLGLLLFTNSDRGPSLRGGATAATEALVFIPPALEPANPKSQAGERAEGSGTMGLKNFTY